MQVLHPIFYHHHFYRHLLVFATFLGLAVFAVAFVLMGGNDEKQGDNQQDSEKMDSTE
ncbi:hypothetical protein LDB30_06055 [Acidithiobacillus ferrooxidans]|nr:hypothetical protein LDB30_06055 [Acidithiobacillus ferrooxidans]